MPLQSFVDKVGPVISAAWLNAVDQLKLTVFGDAVTKADARTALTSDAPLEVLNGGTGQRTLSALTNDLLPYIFVQTPEEALDGITITDYSYPPGHIARYGVDLTGATDTTAEFQACADFCSAYGVPISGSAGSTTISSTLTLNCSGDLGMVNVYCPSTTISPAVRVGVIAAGPTQLNGVLVLPKVYNTTKPALGWAAQQIGVEVADLYQSKITVPYISGFAVGLDCGGHSSGCSYNIFDLLMLANNKVSIRLQGKTTGGWCNQNTFIGGRCFVDSSEITDTSGKYIQLTPLSSLTNDNSWPNGNTFIGTTLEYKQPDYLLEIGGAYNQFINCRFEATPAPVLFTGHLTETTNAHNQIIGGYNAGALVITKAGICLYNEVIAAAIHSTGGSGVVWNMKNESSSAYPLIQGFPAGSVEQHLNATQTATSWTVRLAADFLWGKATGDGTSTYRIKIDFDTGKLWLPYLYNYVDDAAAGADGVAIGQVYRNGSVLMVRVT
ncbi:hypothetical protein CCP3SC15_580002 [Gammaproteobacteria bacterium]